LGVALFRLVDLPLVISPTRLGKWTTTLQICTILLVLVGKVWALPPPIFPAMFWLTGGVTALCWVQYVIVGLRLMGHSQRPGGGENGRG
jgi:phosphatidylglycerophosphate synthase